MTRCLIVANRSMGGHKLVQHLKHLVETKGPLQFHIVVPERGVEAYEFFWATGFGLPEGLSSVVEDGLRRAQDRLDAALAQLRADGFNVTGELGPAPPLAAISSALKEFEYDEIVISTLPVGYSKWLNMDLPRRTRRRFGLPVTTVINHIDEPTLADLHDQAVFAAAAESDVRISLRDVALEHPIQVLVCDSDSAAGQRALSGLRQTGLCATHEMHSVAESLAYLRGEGSFAGRAIPDVVVVTVATQLDNPEQIDEVSEEVLSAGRALLVVDDNDAEPSRHVADLLHAWAFVPLPDDEAHNVEVLELMLVELVALEHKSVG